jgi:hypothetical protein
MNLLPFFLLKGLHQKLDNKGYFPTRKILESSMFLDLFNERTFHILLKFLHFAEKKVTMRPLAVLKNCINSTPYWTAYIPNLGVYIP